MVAAVTVNDSEARTFSVFSGTAVSAKVPGTRVFSIYNFPSALLETSAERTYAIVKSSGSVQVTQERTYVIAQGKIDNHRVRAFPIRLDGHKLYVLRLGATETLVYDLSTQQWMQWASEDLTQVWRPSIGTNWTGMGKAFFDLGCTSDVILGDDTFGLLWGLDAENGVDDNPTPGLPKLPYTRRVVGGVPMRMRDKKINGAAYLTADLGTPQTLGASITLRTSDDYGKTWQSQGTLTVTPGNYDQEFVWRSIGLIKAPGRIFELTDNGATVRIDGLDIR